MCDLSGDFILCSCEGEQLSAPDWILERLDPSLPLQHLRGRAATIHLHKDEASTRWRVLERLNGANCFDFDFEARDGDVLIFPQLLSRPLRLRFMGGRWAPDPSNGLTGWRAQMVRDRTGKLG